MFHHVASFWSELRFHDPTKSFVCVFRVAAPVLFDQAMKTTINAILCNFLAPKSVITTIRIV
jgi:hypothetical protein